MTQPGLLEAPGLISGPSRWMGEGLSDEDSQTVDQILASKPLGLAAWPDGMGAHWLLDAHLMSPDSCLWWCLGKRLVRADPDAAKPLADAYKLLAKTAEWLEIQWGSLPGVAEPHQAPYPFSVLATGLPGASAGILVQVLRATPIDLAPDRSDETDMMLSPRPPSSLLRREAQLLAEAGGYPSPELAGWVIQTAFRPEGAQPSRSIKRLAGIASQWPYVFRAVGLPQEDPSPFVDFSEEAAALLNEAARAVLVGGTPPKPRELAREVGALEVVEL